MVLHIAFAYVHPNSEISHFQVRAQGDCAIRVLLVSYALQGSNTGKE